MTAVHGTARRVAFGEPVEPVTPPRPRTAGPPPIGYAVSNVVRCGVDPRAESVKRARDFAAESLRSWSLTQLIPPHRAPELGDIVELVVSELVTNALRHGLTERVERVTDVAGTCGRADPPSPVELILVCKSAHLICIVTDPGDAVPVLGDPEDLAESGRGLRVVDSCSRRWGWAHFAAGGKAVWAMVHYEP